MWPLHAECSHRQSMSGVFSIASHCALQYLPVVAVHEQIGCAHLSVFTGSICFLLVSDVERMIRAWMLVVRKVYFCTETNRLRYWSHRCRRRWESFGCKAGTLRNYFLGSQSMHARAWPQFGRDKSARVRCHGSLRSDPADS